MTSHIKNPKDHIILALDVESIDEVKRAVVELGEYVGHFKIGLQLAMKLGVPQVIEELSKLDGSIFLDCKFNDIPNTIEKAVEAVSDKVAMFTVHASSGSEGLQAAVRAKRESLLLAVTVLTSLTNEDSEVLFNEKVSEKVITFASLSQEAGANGIVCSSHELALLHGHQNLKKLIKVVPGIRPDWAKSDDQSRTSTPKQALFDGANFLVIGRPIMQPPSNIGSRKKAAELILEEIAC
jgi:orotidine-5'-phosphate decarboxylase